MSIIFELYTATRQIYVIIPLDMIPYSFGGESVKEKAIVAFPRSMEMLFGLSRSL